ncbi:MAG: hypothetical protein JWM62_2050 [Frankiales bacterium]|jgi:hypothetical protein|nr:hypothetical protein [Frankiales bacterium]
MTPAVRERARRLAQVRRELIVATRRSEREDVAPPEPSGNTQVA